MCSPRWVAVLDFPLPVRGDDDVVCYDLDLVRLFVADKIGKNGSNQGCHTADFIVRHLNLRSKSRCEDYDMPRNDDDRNIISLAPGIELFESGI